MPSPRLRSRRRRECIGRDHWLVLGRGSKTQYEPWGFALHKTPCDLAIIDPALDDMRRVWELVGKNLLAHWIRAFPGTRPQAWWWFERGFDEHRKVLSGVGYDRVSSGVTEGWRRIIIQFGVCGAWGTQEEARTVCESEYGYLQRLDLLTAAEKKIPASEFPASTEEEDKRFRDDESWLRLNL